MRETSGACAVATRIGAEKQKGELSDLSVKQLQKRIDALKD